MHRRHFLQLAAAAGAGMMLDPERLLWVPGAKTYFIPDTTVVKAATMAEALTAGLRAVVPNGHGGWCDLMVRLEPRSLEAERAAIEAMGGRIVARRTFAEVETRHG